MKINRDALSKTIGLRMVSVGEPDSYINYYNQILDSIENPNLVKSLIFQEGGPPMKIKQELWCAATKGFKRNSSRECNNYSLQNPGNYSLGLAELEVHKRINTIEEPEPLNFNTNPSVIAVDGSDIIDDQDFPSENQTRLFIPLDQELYLGIPIVNLKCERIYKYLRTSEPQVTDERDEELEEGHGAVYDNITSFKTRFPATSLKVFSDDPYESADKKGEFLAIDRDFIGISTTPSPFVNDTMLSYHIPLELDPLQYVEHSSDLFLFVGRDNDGNGSCLYALNTFNARNRKIKEWPAVWTKLMMNDSEKQLVLRDNNTLDVYEWFETGYRFSHRLTISVSRGADVGAIPPNTTRFGLPIIELNERLEASLDYLEKQDQ